VSNKKEKLMFEFSRGNYEQKSVQILEATRGLSSTNLEGTHLIECLRSQLKDVTEEMERLRFGWECYKNYKKNIDAR